MVSSHSFVIDPTLTSASQGVLWPQDPLRRLIRMGTNPLKCSVPDEMWGFRSFCGCEEPRREGVRELRVSSVQHKELRGGGS